MTDATSRDAEQRGSHCAECGEWYPADGETAGVMGGRFLCAECCGEPVVFVVECLDCDELEYRYSGRSSSRDHVKQRVQQEGNSHETRKSQFEGESHETVWREVEPTPAEQQNPVRPEDVELASDGGRPSNVEYRIRLDDPSDSQVDAWERELDKLVENYEGDAEVMRHAE